MIDQDKMRALAAKLHATSKQLIVEMKCGELTMANPHTLNEAADAIDLLLAEVEAAAADKREMHAILLAVAILFWESNGSWTSLRYEADRAIKAALAQRQGEGS